MILVTGGTGLVGSHLLYDLIRDGSDVKVLVREKSNRLNILKTFMFYNEDARQLYDKIQWVTGDITDRASLDDAFEDVDQVYHTAALVSFGRRQSHQVMEVNAEGTANLVNICLDRAVKKLCFVSSIASVVNPEDDSPSDENLIWKPEKNASIYSVSKLKAEMEVWRGINEGLKAVIVNPSIILGPGNWEKGSPALFDLIAKGIPYYTSGSNGFVDVRDVSSIMIRLMNSDITGERFILNSGNLTYKDLIDKIENALGKVRRKKYIPKVYLNLLGGIESFSGIFSSKEQVLSKSFIDIAYKKSSYSNEKIRLKLNVDFRSIDEAVKNIALAYNNIRKG